MIHQYTAFQKVDFKNDSTICYSQETHFKYNDIVRLKNDATILNINQKKVEVDILSHRTDFKVKEITKDQKGYFIMIKQRATLNTSAPINMVAKYVKRN